MMINLVRPKYFIPIHGEYRHLVYHARLAEGLRIPEENIFIIENGDVVEFGINRGAVTGKIETGKPILLVNVKSQTEFQELIEGDQKQQEFSFVRKTY